MAITPSGLAPAVGRAARWASRLLSAAAGKFGLLVAALVALMGAAPLIPSAASHAVLALFTDRERAAAMGAAGRKWARQMFSQEALAESLQYLLRPYGFEQGARLKLVPAGGER